MLTGNTSEEVGGITTTVTGTATTETGITGTIMDFTGTATTEMEATAIMAMGTATEAWPDTETADKESLLYVFTVFFCLPHGRPGKAQSYFNEGGWVKRGGWGIYCCLISSKEQN